MVDVHKIATDGVKQAFDQLSDDGVTIRSIRFNSDTLTEYVLGGEDPTDKTSTTTIRGLFKSVRKERFKLMTDPTKDHREVLIIQDEYSGTPKLEDIVIDGSTNWVIKAVEEDPAKVTWNLFVMRQ